MCPIRTLDVGSPLGPARVHVDGPVGGALLVLGHGAGGSVDAPDLLAARDGALALGWGVVRAEQPYRVAGRRVPEPAPRLDAAWLAVLDRLAALPGRAGAAGLPLVVGGRSSGARVACRTAASAGAAAVVALAFPLRPPPRGGRAVPDRADELALPAVPRLVVQGERDAFGVPEPSAGVTVAVVAGADHGFAVRRADGRTAREVREEVRARVTAFLAAVLPGVAGEAGQTLT